MAVDVAVFDLPAPADLAALAKVIDAFDPGSIHRLALLIRVPGEYEDGSRDRARAALREFLAARGLSDRTEYVTVIGSEGATTPCGVALISSAGTTGDAVVSEPRLALGLARQTPPDEASFGTAAFARFIAGVVKSGIEDAGLKPAEVQLAVVNVPQPTTGNVGLRGRQARAAAALGAGIAIGELREADVTDSRILADLSLFTPRVQTFAGPAITHIEVMVLGNRPGAGGSYVACNTVTSDLIDMRPMKRMLRDAGLAIDADGELDTSRLKAVIAKLGVRPDGVVDGAPTTIFSSVTPPEKHVRAAMSGALGVVLHTTRVFGTFDPIHQSPNGGGTICCIVSAKKS